MESQFIYAFRWLAVKCILKFALFHLISRSIEILILSINGNFTTLCHEPVSLLLHTYFFVTINQQHKSKKKKTHQTLVTASNLILAQLFLQNSVLFLH